MTTQQQIDDPAQWRVGDRGRIDFHNGGVAEGPVELEGSSLAVLGHIVRDHSGEVRAENYKTITVTRTVEPIPEPTVPWALVRFADGTVLIRVGRATGYPWMDDYSTQWSWGTLVSDHGAPVAVSLPHWSDEADGLRAGVVALAAEWERVAYEAGGSTITGQTTRAHADRLRALLAEGGAA